MSDNVILFISQVQLHDNGTVRVKVRLVYKRRKSWKQHRTTDEMYFDDIQ